MRIIISRRKIVALLLFVACLDPNPGNPSLFARWVGIGIYISIQICYRAGLAF